MQIAVLGRILLVLLITVAVLGVVGWMQSKRAAKRGDATETREETENVADLRDRFNRARYMDMDGN